MAGDCTDVKSLKISAVALVLGVCQLFAQTPQVGSKAPEFRLSTMQAKPVGLSEITGKSSVVLVVLRGYPGYQCPYCTRQVQEFVSHAPDFAAKGAEVVFIYPGPPDELPSKAAESAAGKELPAHFTLLLDPGYDFTNRYGLRWDAPKETAYPTTYVLDKQGTITWLKSAKAHAGRATAAEVLEVLK